MVSIFDDASAIGDNEVIFMMRNGHAAGSGDELRFYVFKKD